MSYFKLSNGEELYYRDTGKGEDTILMLHGWSSNHRVYASTIPAISEKARCITYDHRGHGNSIGANKDHVTMDTLAGDLDEIIRGMGLKDITLVGWSMGAGVVMNYTSIYGCGALKQVVLCDMTPKQMNDEEWKLGLYQGSYTKEEMEEDAGKDFLTLYKAFAIGAIPNLRKMPDFLLRNALKRRLKDCDEKVLVSLSRSMKAKDFRNCVERITVPVYYFYAVPGSLFSPELKNWYNEHVYTPFKAVPFQKSTHMLITDHPHQFARNILRVINKEDTKDYSYKSRVQLLNNNAE